MNNYRFLMRAKHLLRRDYRRCVKLLMECNEQVAMHANITERILHNFTIAKLLRLARKDPKPFLAKAREDAIACEWKTMQKLILAESATYFDSVDNLESRDKVFDLFSDLELETSQTIPWMLI
ncbi:unnamed protein product [Caenorhabditis angaria]|uniref:Uncharacterized protein n=1 Tax=Caenorhabditis angaria TaxID=860376 RepID=A0A9P1MZR3_9PELO|nr:unnamed protein product [Caenorhabditis angaria]